MGVRFSLTHTLSASGKTTTILAIPVGFSSEYEVQANYSVKQRIQSIFGNPISSTLCEFGSSFCLPPAISQEMSALDSTLSTLSSSTSQETSTVTPPNETDRIEYQFSTHCDWGFHLPPSTDQELNGFVTGFSSRVGSSNNGSNRGGQYLMAKGGITKQLLFINGRMIEDKKVVVRRGIDSRF